MLFDHSTSTPASQSQLECLASLGVTSEWALSRHQADKLIREHKTEWANLPPTRHQELYLKQRARWKEGMRRGEATALIGRLKAKIAELERTVDIDPQ